MYTTGMTCGQLMVNIKFNENIDKRIISLLHSKYKN